MGTDIVGVGLRAYPATQQPQQVASPMQPETRDTKLETAKDTLRG
jgi:hypothetical protein